MYSCYSCTAWLKLPILKNHFKTTHEVVKQFLLFFISKNNAAGVELKISLIEETVEDVLTWQSFIVQCLVEVLLSEQGLPPFNAGTAI